MVYRYYNTNRASKFIYGIILMFVFVISQSHNSGTTAISLAVLALLASVAFSFAEIYSEILGDRIKNKGKVNKKERFDLISDSFSIVSTGVLISFIFLLSALDLYNVKNAFDLSYAILLLLLFGFSFWAYRLSGYSSLKSIIISVISVLAALIVIGLKYIFGH